MSNFQNDFNKWFDGVKQIYPNATLTQINHENLKMYDLNLHNGAKTFQIIKDDEFFDFVIQLPMANRQYNCMDSNISTFIMVQCQTSGLLKQKYAKVWIETNSNGHSKDDYRLFDEDTYTRWRMGYWIKKNEIKEGRSENSPPAPTMPTDSDLILLPNEKSGSTLQFCNDLLLTVQLSEIWKDLS